MIRKIRDKVKQSGFSEKIYVYKPRCLCYTIVDKVPEGQLQR